MTALDLDRFPRVRLAHLPTPLEPLERLSAHLGGPRVLVKRDDCTGLAFGGNKARKLEFLIADALAKGADILIHEGVIPDYGMTKAGKFSRKVCHEKETKNQRTGHTSPTGLGKLAEQAGVKKLVAYHLAPYTSVPAAVEMSEKYTGPNPGPEIWSKFIHAMKNQYSGPVILAEDAMVIKV